MFEVSAGTSKGDEMTEINEMPDPDARREAWLNWSPGREEQSAAFPPRTFPAGFDIEADVHTPGAESKGDGMSTTYAIGDGVIYDGEQPDSDCDDVGEVTAVEPDASGGQVVTVEFGCGHVQDILASELRPAG
jgi:hypothetical protein